MATKKTNAVVMAAVNGARANASAAYQNIIPELTEDNFGTWAASLCANGGAFNEFYDQLHKNIYMNVLYDDIFENKLAPMKKGFITTGAGVREYAMGEVDVLGYDLSEVEKRELKTYLQEMFEAVYQVNVERMYPTTLGRIQFRESLGSMDDVYRFVTSLRDNVRKWEQVDELTLMVTMIQNNIVNGMWPVRPVDMSDLSNLYEELQTISDDLEEPRREWTPFGNPNSSPKSRQILIMTNRMKAKLGTHIRVGAYNLDELWLPGRQFHVSRLDQAYYENRLAMLRDVNKDIPDFSAAQLANLKNVVAIIMDERVLQIWDYVYETWEKERASAMDINYFLHVWQIFATSPFWPVVVLVDSSADTAEPENLEATIVSKTQTAKGVSLNVNIANPAGGLVGGNAHLIQTDEAIAAGLFTRRSGNIVIESGSEGAVITADLYGTHYASAEAVTSEANVGDKIALAKVQA